MYTLSKFLEFGAEDKQGYHHYIGNTSDIIVPQISIHISANDFFQLNLLKSPCPPQRANLNIL